MEYSGKAIFMDGDMIVQDDISSLWDLFDDQYAVQVVKHNYNTKVKIKYLDSINENYPCKNWSSVILWNCNNHKNHILTPKFIQDSSGSQLHRFTWLEESDIGNLPIDWNWLPDEFGENEKAKLLHYTLGTPCFHEFSNGSMAENWHNEKKLMEYYKR
jgi:lipopolysaccharide biosynthesis glycosyltransferase